MRSARPCVTRRWRTSGAGERLPIRSTTDRRQCRPRCPLTVLLAGQNGKCQSPLPTARRCQPSRWRRGSSSTIPRIIPGLGWLNLSSAAGAPRSAAPAPAAVRMHRLVGAHSRERAAARRDRRGRHAAPDRRQGGPSRCWPIVATSSGPSSTNRAPTTPGISRRTTAKERGRGVETIEAVETGPLRGAVRVSRTWRDSRIEQTYRLLTGSRRLDIATRIDWHERQTCLALLPLQQPRGDLRDAVRRDSPPNPPQHLLGRRALRGQRPSLCRSLRTGLWRGAAQ